MQSNSNHRFHARHEHAPSGSYVICPSGISSDSDYEGHCDMDGDMTVAQSCRAHYLAGVTHSGPQRISTPTGSVDVYCDMDDGGWTLIGKVNGDPRMGDTFLRSAENVELLAAIGPANMPSTGQSASIDAIDIAVNHATHVKLSSSDGASWSRWEMDAARTTSTWWNRAEHAAAQGPENSIVQVEGSGGSSTCNQNPYGIMKLDGHGYGYPCV